jgi:hypothetical protein
LKRHDVERAVYRRYQELHATWFAKVNEIYEDTHEWALIRAIDLYSSMFDDLRDQLLGSGFYEEKPSPHDADFLIDRLREKLEGVVDTERQEARRLKALT